MDRIRFSEYDTEQDAGGQLSENMDDYIFINIRLLSATIVGGETFKATFFSEDVLKSSMHLLPNLPVFANGTKTGYIERVEWSESRMQNGVTIAPGINAVCAIDFKKAPQLVRNILGGAVTANAVNVEFSWRESHEIQDFQSQIGKYNEYGNMYCRIAERINAYIDTAFDFRSLDPFARVFDKSGDLKRIDTNYIFNRKQEPPTKAEIDERRLIDNEIN